VGTDWNFDRDGRLLNRSPENSAAATAFFRFSFCLSAARSYGQEMLEGWSRAAEKEKEVVGRSRAVNSQLLTEFGNNDALHATNELFLCTNGQPIRRVRCSDAQRKGDVTKTNGPDAV
jgi:hypothetical protein